MNILITGGAGFIGSHLAGELLKEGNEVCVIDDFSTGSPSNVKNLQKHENFLLKKGSVLDISLMKEAIKNADVIYHLAAAVGVKYIMENPLEAIRVNVRGTEIVLELAEKKKQPVLIASSSEVYGKNGQIPYKESGDRVMGPTTAHRWNYACTKALDEFLALSYHKKKQLPIVIARFFNTCGIRQTGQYGMVIPRFVESALKNEPVVIHGDGSQSRCFIDVVDTVRGIKLLMQTPGAVGEIFNIGSENEITIYDLAHKIIQMTSSSSETRCIPHEEVYGQGFEDMKRRVPDISKINNYTGWKPTVSIDNLLSKIIDYHRTILF